MPLSEHEQRLLDEMERSLYHGEADDVTTVGGRARPNYTAIALGVVAGVAGIALLLVGVITRLPVVGLVGFVVMFAGALFAITPPRALTVPRQAGSRRSRLMESLNERWERRDDEG
ncbi:MAG: DUF3040 domain-containing protein [Microbacteriaceae bacterium]|nr:DUF3040 domain-containing protein [Microbacteriaceae bacterium]